MARWSSGSGPRYLAADKRPTAIWSANSSSTNAAAVVAVASVVCGSAALTTIGRVAVLVVDVRDPGEECDEVGDLLIRELQVGHRAPVPAAPSRTGPGPEELAEVERGLAVA